VVVVVVGHAYNPFMNLDRGIKIPMAKEAQEGATKKWNRHDWMNYLFKDEHQWTLFI